MLRIHHSLDRQRGAALYILLLLVLVGAFALFGGSLNNSQQQRAENDQKTRAALQQAKEALIAYAAADDNRPGELPCPDYNNDGEITLADYDGSACQSYIGRLPWKTLGLPDLRDSGGERLWYAISKDFHANSTAKLNSDTPGQLTISGANPMNNVIAIIFSPGAAIAGQVRDVANENNVHNYLESDNAAGGATNTSFTSAPSSPTFNDQLIAITHDDLFPVVEKRVANEVKKSLNALGLPWAAQFGDPTAETTDFFPHVGTTEGWLPAYTFSWVIGASAVPVTWGTVTLDDFNDAIDNKTKKPKRDNSPGYCTGYRTGDFTCTAIFLLQGGQIRRHISIIFSDSYGGSDPHTAKFTGNLANTLSIADYCLVLSATCPSVNAQVGAGYFDTDASSKTASSITLSRSQTQAFPNWLVKNNWHKVIYYAVSPGYAQPDMTRPKSSCTPRGATWSAPSCLRVNNLADTNNNNDKQAVIIMAGHKLTGLTRPSAALSDYLEGENASPLDFIFEKNTRSATFNDQIFVVSP